MSIRALRHGIAISLVFAFAAVPLWAVTTETWHEHQPDEFEKGRCEGTVISSLGRVTLGRAETEILGPNDDVDFINALVQAPDGTVYAATGPSGMVYRIVGDKADRLCKIEGESNLFSLLIAADGSLLVGAGGSVGRIYRVDKAGVATPWFDPVKTIPVRPTTQKGSEKTTESASAEKQEAIPNPTTITTTATTTTTSASLTTATTTTTTAAAESTGINYVWAMVHGPAGTVYAATGPAGLLLQIDPDGTSCRVLFDSKETNLLSLAIDRAGYLYCGSDKRGLIYRIDPLRDDPTTRKSEGPGVRRLDSPYVLYDTGEAEVSALAVDSAGNVYAATASPAAARPGKTAKPKPAGLPSATTHPTSTKPSKAGPPPMTRSVGHPVLSAPPLPGAPAEGKGAGNAVYRIAPDGMVTEVFREPVMILCMIEAEGTLYLGTGNEGRVFEVRPDREEQIALVKVKDSQVTALVRGNDGKILLGTSNRGRVVRLSEGYAAQGTFTSQVLDAKQISRWGRVQWEGELPKDATVTVATRSGNVADPEEGTWEAWSNTPDARQGSQIPSTSARFLQYRLTLTTKDPKQTPSIRSVKLARQANNLPPKVLSLDITGPLRSQKAMAAGMGGPPPGGEGEGAGPRPLPPGTLPTTRIIKWKAQDPNGDQLLFDLYFRLIGSQRWILLKEDNKTTDFKWDTSKVGDGSYEIRVVAKDLPSNPPSSALATDRISDIVIVDNTPPVVAPITVTKLGKGMFRIHAVLTDKQSVISAAHYAVDSQEEWVTVLAEDDLFDSLIETISFEVDDLKAGEHVITIRARDEQENRGYASVSVSVDD